jgi:GAF domain-containing protein/PAS domain-containing protein
MSDSIRSRLEALDPFLHHVLRETGAYGGGIFLIPPGEQALGLAVKGYMPDTFAGPWRRIWLGARTPVTDSARERRLIWLPVGEMVTRYPASAAVLPYRFAAVCAPLATGEIVWGSLALLFPASQPPRLAPQQRAAVEECCEGIGRLLADASELGRPLLLGPEPHKIRRPPADTPAHATAVAALNFSQRLPEGGMALDMEGRVTFVTARAAELIGVSAEGVYGQRLWELLPWLSDQVFEDRYRAALLSREPTTFTALRPPGTWLSFVLYADDSGLSVRITAPLKPPQFAPPPTGADLGAAQADGPSALGMDTAPLGTMYGLMHLAAMLTQAVEVDEIMKLAANPIMAMFEAQGVVLLALEDGRLKNVGYNGYEAEAMQRLDGAQMRSTPTPASKALSNREATFYSTPDEMDAVYDGMSTLTNKAAWAYLPLIVSDRAVGCCVIAYDNPRTFTPGERAFLTSLAGLLAQALDRALLHDARYLFARRLQAAFLPSALPEVPGLRVAARYRAAAHGMEIGGDFYDLIGLSTGAAAAIGDVQGHNSTAAALMGQVRTAVHATAGAPPSEVLSRTNRLLTDLNAGLFTSCLYADIDLVAHRVRLANAGHPPPLLRHQDGTVSVVRVPPGPLLGIVPAAEYPTVEIPLPPGAELLLYTDGLVEIPGADPDDSIAELARSLAATPRGESVDTRADLLLKNAPPAAGIDDIALLLISTS